MRNLLFGQTPTDENDEVTMSDVHKINENQIKEGYIEHKERNNETSCKSSEIMKRDVRTKDFKKSWDSVPSVNHSFSTVGSSATLCALKHFGLSNHPGKSVDDIIIDAFMDIGDDTEKSICRTNSKARFPEPKFPEMKYKDRHKEALSCIARHDFDKLLKIVDTSPEILLYQCKKSGLDIQQEPDEKTHLRGCHGGTLLHVLVSQKPMLRKKRFRGSSNPMKDRVKKAFSCNNRNTVHIHVIPSVPYGIVRHIIKKAPESLVMTDDYGRLPIHCAILSQATHVEEVWNMYGTLESTGIFSFINISFIVGGVNLVHILIKSNPSTVTIGDLKGNLPLHYALSIGSDYFESNNVVYDKPDRYKTPSAVETVRLLLETNPRSVSIRNFEGNLPIHHMIATKGSEINISSLKLVTSFNNLCKDVVKERNRDGDPPLILAIKSRSSKEVIKTIASIDSGTSNTQQLFAQCDSQRDNPLHVALRLRPRVDPEIIRTIINLAPFLASQPDSRNVMPIRYATEQDLQDDIIRQMLARDMPIQVGPNDYSSERGHSGVARHIVEKSHHNSFWHVVIECNDKYLFMIKSFLSEEATHAQIVTLARQVGPDGISILINCVSDKCRLVFHSLLRFYERYEILLSSKDVRVEHNDILDGIQTFLALDHGLSTQVPSEYCYSKLHKTASDLSMSSEQSISTAVRVRNDKKSDSEVEVSLLSKEKSKVLLRCYQYEEAFFAEVKVRQTYEFPRQYFEELYNYHRDETYTCLFLSREEKLCCITFERPDHSLAEVFASVSSGGKRSQKWIEKCWIVLKQIATALKFLHDQNLIHGHLAAQNIAKYGNTWKVGKLGTVTRKGSRMRGNFRPCVPPESIFQSDQIKNSSRNNLQEVESMGLGPRVKFSQSVEEADLLGQEKKTVDSRDDYVLVSRDNGVRQGTESNDDLISFLPCGTSYSQSKSLEDSSQPTKITKSKKILSRVDFVPERCEANPQWDMWGYGLIMVQLLLGRCMLLPNFEKAEDAVLKKLLNYNEDSLKKICNQLSTVAGQDATDLVMSLLQKDPKLRPRSMEDVLAHNYFKVLTIYV